ncbi:hypothetical protein IPM19_04945 [bacterium]|nr:MAG: hypothetical protein IPM19_04945 [bacterium]
MKKSKFFNLLLLILLGGFIVTIHLISHPLGFNNYGYDYGFYSYAVQHTPLNSLHYMAGQVNDYGNHLFVFLNWLRLPQLPALHVLFVAFYAFSGMVLYAILKKYGRVAAITGIILFAFSIAQTQSYTMFLWKAAYGQLLLLIIFFLIQQKKYFWELIPLLLIIITHKTTAIMAAASLLPYYVFAPVKNKNIFVASLVAVILIFLFGLNGYNYFLRLLDSHVQDGQFLTVIDYLRYSWYLIPLAAVSVYQSIKNRSHIPWLGMLIVSVGFMIFKITFYQRVILYADLGLIFFTSLTIASLKIESKYKIIIAILTIALALGNFLVFSNNNVEPLITEPEILEIKEFTAKNQGAFVLSLSAQDAPWLLANLGGKHPTGRSRAVRRQEHPRTMGKFLGLSQK